MTDWRRGRGRRGRGYRPRREAPRAGAGADRRARAGDSTRSCTRRSAPGSPAADSVLRVQRLRSPGAALAHRARGDGGHGRLEQRTRRAHAARRAADRTYADSAARLRRGSSAPKATRFPRTRASRREDVAPSLQAIVLERRRAVKGDSAVLADILGPDPPSSTITATPGCWAGWAPAPRTRWSRDSCAADSEEFKVRYLTLLSYFTDPALIPFLARVYAAPDSVGLPKRYAIRASDGLLWIGTRESLQALLDARAQARARGVYDDPSLRHARSRFSGKRQLVGDQPDGEVADDWVERALISSSGWGRRRSGRGRTPRRTGAR